MLKAVPIVFLSVACHITVVVADRLGVDHMGQKVHPTGIRLGISKPWTSTWYANTADYADNLFT